MVLKPSVYGYLPSPPPPPPPPLMLLLLLLHPPWPCAMPSTMHSAVEEAGVAVGVVEGEVAVGLTKVEEEAKE